MADFTSISLPFLIINSIYIVVQLVYIGVFKRKPALVLWCLSKIRVNCLMQFMYLTIEVGLFLPPFVLYIVWGALLVASPDISNHVGYGIMWLGTALHTFILGILFFWLRKWRHTTASVSLILMGLLCLLVYLYVVIAVPSIFSYTGAMAVYLSHQYFSLVWIFYCIYNYRTKISFEKFVEEMDDDGNKEVEQERIFMKAVNSTRWQYGITIAFNLLFYLLEFVVISVVIAVEAPEQHKALGIINSFILLLVDTILLIWLMLCQSPIFSSPTKGCLTFLIPRIVICFAPDYWILIHSLVFLTLLLIFSTIWILNNINVKSKSEIPEDELIKSIGVFQKLGDHINKKENIQMNFKAAAKAGNAIKNKCCRKFLEGIPTLILLCLFLVYWAVTYTLEESKDTRLKYAFPKKIELQRNYTQNTYTGLFFTLYISYVLLAIWFRLFQKWQYKVGPILLVMAGCSSLIIIVVGIIYTAIILKNTSTGVKSITYTSFICGPIVIYCTAIFYGIWRSNDYYFYEPQMKEVPSYRKEKNRDVGGEEEIKDLSDEESKDDMVNSASKINIKTKDEAKEETKKVAVGAKWYRRGCIGMLLPVQIKDFLSLITFHVNIITITAWFVINTVLYTDRWLPILIYLWFVTLQSGTMGLLKLYHCHYNFRSWWIWYPLTTAVVYYIAAFAVFLVYGFTEKDERLQQSLFIAFFILHFGVPIVAAYLLGAVYIREGIRKFPWVKYVLLVLGLILVIIVGVFAFVFGYYASGAALVIAVVMLFVQFLLDLKCTVSWTKPIVRKIVFSFVLIFAFVVTTILLGTLIESKSRAVMTMVTLLFYSTLGYSIVMFVLNYRENVMKAKNQIYVYTKLVIPMLRFVPDTSGGQGHMVHNNDETIYFCISLGGFFIWSLLAGMLFKEDQRYIGLALTGLSFVILVLYYFDKQNRATTLDYAKISYINKDIYSDLQKDALQYRKNLNASKQKKEQMDQAEGSIFEYKKEILTIFDEWECFASKAEKTLHGIFYLNMLTTRLFRLLQRKSPNVDFKNEEIKDFDAELSGAGGDLGKKVKILRKSYENCDREYSFNRQYNAYFLGQMLIYINGRQDELDSVMRKVLSDMASMLKDNDQYKELIPLLNVIDFPQIAENYQDTFESAFDQYLQKQELLLNDRDARMKEEQRKREERERRLREQEEARKLEEQRKRDEEANRLRQEEEERQRRVAEELARISDETERKKKEEEERRRQEEAQRLIDQQLQAEIKVLKSGSEEDKLFLQQGESKLDMHKGSLYTDEDWSGEDALFINPSAGYADDPSAWKNVPWKRVSQLKDRSGRVTGDRARVFSTDEEGIDVNDILQGGLGDCWFLSAIAGTAYTRPDLVKRIFHPKSHKINKDGAYCLRFFKTSRQQIVEIDDLFPANQYGKSKFVGLHATQTTDEVEIWPLLIEKAYAKLHGSYEAIEGGMTNEGYGDLTGGISKNYWFDEQDFRTIKNNGSFWPMIQELIDEGHLLGISSAGASDKVTNTQGVVEGHAYTMLDAQEIDGHRIIQARNPWGNKEWTGKWGDDDPMWTKKRIEQMKASQKARGRNIQELGPDDGIFWIGVEDMFRYFDSLQICYLYEGNGWDRHRILAEWKGTTAGGCMNNLDTYFNNPQFKLTVTEDADLVFHMAQPDSRGGDSMVCINFSIFDNGGEMMTSYKKPVLKADLFSSVRDLMQKGHLKKSDHPYTVIPCTFESGCEREFTFTVYSKQKVILDKF